MLSVQYKYDDVLQYSCYILGEYCHCHCLCREGKSRTKHSAQSLNPASRQTFISSTVVLASSSGWVKVAICSAAGYIGATTHLIVAVMIR